MSYPLTDFQMGIVLGMCIPSCIYLIKKIFFD